MESFIIGVLGAALVFMGGLLILIAIVALCDKGARDAKRNSSGS